MRFPLVGPALWLVCLPFPSAAEEGAAATPAVQDITEIDIESLLEPSVETASKRKQSVEEAPSIVTVFTRQEIEQLGVRRLIELLKLVPGFIEVSAPMERNIASRGVHAFTSQNVVVLIDGLRMNDFLANTAAPDSFLVAIAERVEIIRGPGAALYGSNALTGVVNIITVDPRNASRFVASAGIGINETYTGTLQHAMPVGESGGLLMSLVYDQTRGTPVKVPGSEDVLVTNLGANTADGIQEGENLNRPESETPTRVNRYGPSLEGIVKYQSDEVAVRLGLGHREFRPQRTELETLIRVNQQSQPPSRQDSRLSLDVTRSWGKEDGLGKLTLRPALQYFRHEQRSQRIAEEFYDAAADQRRISILSWSGEDLRASTTAEYSKSFGEWLVFKEASLLTGAQLEYSVAMNYQLNLCQPDPTHEFGPSAYSEDETGNDYVCLRGAPLLEEGQAIDKWGNRVLLDKSYNGNGDDVSLGYFLQLNSELPWDIGFTVGGRLDYNPDYDPVFTPRVGLVKQVNENVYVKALYASAFVYPPFLYRTGNRQASIVGNPDMLPESIQTFELQAGLRTSSLRFELNGYYNIIKDFITFDETRFASSREYAFDNRGDVTVAGIESSASVFLWNNRLRTTVSAAGNRPVESGTDEIFLVDGNLGGPSKYPDYSGSLIVNIQPLDPINVNLNAVYVAESTFTVAETNRFEDVGAQGGGTLSSKAAADYDTSRLNLNAHVSYTFFEQLRLSLQATNILNTSDHVAGATSIPYRTAGRQVLVALRYSE
jgi:outer membrane receptor protein involved in Fe transport